MKKHFFSAILFLYASIAFSQTVYVNHAATGNNDGSNWANAFTDFKFALSQIPVSATNPTIWIAKGTYKPGTNRTDKFEIPRENLTIYGGFAGTESTLADRDISLIHTTNTTIFSGELQGDGTISNNAYNVITILANNITLNGLTISEGNANGTGVNRHGAGIKADNARINTLTIEHCKIENNNAEWAAGIDFSVSRYGSYPNDTGIIIDACIFKNNTANVASAFSVQPYNNGYVNVSITNSLFDGNTSLVAGSPAGSIRAFHARDAVMGTGPDINEVNIVNNTFVNNSSQGTITTANTQPTFALSWDNGPMSGINVANNIFWGNTRTSAGNTTIAPSIDKGHGGNIPGSLHVYNSIGQDNFSTAPNKTNTSNSDPLFTNVTNGFFTLQASSPAVDTGDNTKIPSGINFDIVDNDRRYNNSTVDMGAYEYSGNTSNCSNIVTIPDANFKAALLAHGNSILGHRIGLIDVNRDGEICADEASAYTGLIDVRNKNITNLTGIEAFINTTRLYCNNNQLTNLDVSANTALTSLSCDDNQINNLNVSGSTALQFLNCDNNQLTNIDVSANSNLETLDCNNNLLTALTLPTRTNLFYSLLCDNNQLTTIDLSAYSNLSTLFCENNPQLTSINVATGNNSRVNQIYAVNNPSLTCIQHDSNFNPARDSSWSKDNTANWSDDCQGTTFWSKATTGVTTDWATASNWTNGVPDQSYTGVIPAGANVYPVITTDASTNPIGILTIENGASLYIDPAGSLAADTVTNNGTFSIASNATDSGTFEATTVVGDITYQRYATNRWHLVGSPVSGQDIDAFVSYASNALATNSTTSARAFAVYDNTQAQASDYWQYYQSAANSAMVNAKGYAVKRQNGAGVGILQFKGTYNDSNVTYTGIGSTNNKFEMVSNPYTRYLDLNNFLSSNTSNMSATNAALYFWNDAQNRYDVYNSASTGNQYVAPGQGFFAEMANTGGSFTFRPNMTTHNATGALLRTAPQTEVLISIAEGNSQKTTQIKYLANTGKGLDVGYDAGYFDGNQSNVGIYTQLADGTYNDTNFMLQCVGKDTAEETVIPLGIKTDVARTVTFTAEAMNLPDNLKVFLEDTQTGSVTELSNGGSYEATVNAGSGRFFLHTKESARLSTNNVALEGINIFKQGNNLQIKGVEEASRVVLYTLQGKEVLNAQVTSSQSLVALPKLATGMYIVNVSNSNGSTSKKVIF